MTINHIGGPTAPGGRDSVHKERVDAPKTEPSRPAGLPDGKAPGNDEVRLTGHSLRLRELEASLGEEPAVDNDRVEALRKAIADGAYPVDAARIADKLLRLEGELFK